MPVYDGRLELTWTNRHLRLLAHEDGGYEWVSPSDFRVAEVRLLHEVATVGEVGKVRAADNLLIPGDALPAQKVLAATNHYQSRRSADTVTMHNASEHTAPRLLTLRGQP